VQRVEIPWRQDEHGKWTLGPSFMVCAHDHRVLIEPLL